MQAKILPAILAAVLIAVLGAGAWLLLGERDAREAVSPVQASASPSEAALAPAALVDSGATPAAERSMAEAAPAAPAAAAPEATQARAARVVGRCIDEIGRGIPGVAVECLNQKVSTETGGDGRFALEIPIPAGERRYLRLHARAAGYGIHLFDATLESEEEEDVGDILLKAAGAIAGRVIDAAGLPFKGARVAVQRAESQLDGSRFEGPSEVLVRGESDERGLFRLEEVPAGMVRVWAGAENMAWASTDPIEVLPDAVVRDVALAVLPLESEDTIDLVVVDPSGVAVPRAELAFRYESGYRSGSSSVTADENGRYRVFLEIRAPHSFHASDPARRYRPAFAEGVAPGTHDLVLQLGERKAFVLRVRSDAGEAIERFQAIVVDPPDRIGETDATADPHARRPAGEVEIVLPVTSFQLRVDAEGYESATLGPFDPERTPSVLEAVLRRLPAVRGHVTARGRPVQGARVTLHTAIDPSEQYDVNGFPCRSGRTKSAEGTTDADGAYALALRETGGYYVRAEAQGHAVGEIGPITLDTRDGAEGLDLRLGEGGAIRGHVLVFPDETKGGWIVGISRGDGYGITERTDADGEFHFESLTPGPWLVRWRLDEISPNSTTTSSGGERESDLPWSCEVVEGQTTELDLDLRALRQVVLKGRLRFSGAAPSGWEVAVSPVHGAGGESRSVGLDSEGRFAVAMADPGRYRLAFSGLVGNTSFASFQSTEELAIGDNDWNVDLPIGSVEGRVAETLTSEGAWIQLQWRDGSRFFNVQIDPRSDGTFALPIVPAGSVQIRYGSSEMPGGEIAIEVQAGQRTLVGIP